MPELNLPKKNTENPYGVRFVSQKEFTEIVADKGSTENIALHKPYVMDEVKVHDENSRQMKFVVSTEAVDRDRDVIKASGWKLANFKKNPVVLWAHGYYDPPVAKAPSIGVEDKKLVSVADFVPAEVSPFAESIFQMLKLGFLRTTSVGFIPLKHSFDEDRRGVDILQSELLEYSVVPVPANPEALVQVRSVLKDTDSMKSYAGWCEWFLDQHYGGKGVWVPQDQVNEVFKKMNEITGKETVIVTKEFLSQLEEKAERKPEGDIVAGQTKAIIGDGDNESVVQLSGFDGTSRSVTVKEPEETFLTIIDEPELEKNSDPFLFVSDEPEEKEEVKFEVDEANKIIREVIRDTVKSIVGDSIRQELNYARGIVE